MNIKEINSLLENNPVMVRIGVTWYSLDKLGDMSYKSFPCWVSDDDGGTHEYDIADIDEFDPVFEGFKELDWMNVGIA